MNRHMMKRDGMARELVRLLLASPSGALLVTQAKERFCGATGLISDLHAAMGYAEAHGWIAYSPDYLAIELRPLGRAIGKIRLLPRAC